MTKGECVAEMLRREIASGKWLAGDKLPSEATLCRAYNISRTSIRSAIHTLAVEGLISTYHGKGSFVSSGYRLNASSQLSFSDRQFGRIDMFEFRRILEAECAALVASRADEDTIEMLRENVKQMQLAKTPEAAVEQDMKFHYLIAKATQNAIMPAIYDMLKSAYYKMFFENVALRSIDGYTEHLQILSAIESRNPDQARIYMAEHLNKCMMQNTVTLYRHAETGQQPSCVNDTISSHP